MEPTEPPSVERIRERYDQLVADLRSAAEANGHDPDRLRIVAITKAHAIEVARAALDAGLTRLGESRIQEAEPKIAAMPDAEWHFVGRLQSNKARRAVRAFAVIHSIDSLDLLRRVVDLVSEERSRPGLLIQVNVTGEEAKGGMAPDVLLGRDAIGAVAGSKVTGLMTIPRMGASEAEARAAFRQLRELRDRLREAIGIGLPELSMGMSADAKAAAAEGATLVRIGTALFGPRG